MRIIKTCGALAMLTWSLGCSAPPTDPGGSDSGWQSSDGAAHDGTTTLPDGQTPKKDGGGGGNDAGATDSGGNPPIDAGNPPAHFDTLPIGAALPSEAQCTAWVNAAPTAENMAVNATANKTTPPSNWLAALHANPSADCSPNCSDYANVTGSFTGSTDMILRWAACKWGIDEDIVRAEAWEESSWRQSLEADSDTTCHSQNVAPGALNYWTESSPCKPSKGILQEKMLYWNSWPYALSSTSLNADYRMAAQRTCMEGHVSWMVGKTGAYGTYPPSTTDNALYGCMGHWFSGGWGDSGAVNYVTNLQSILASKSWPH